MIKINLLNSVTDKDVKAVSVAEKKVSSPMTRFILLGLTVGLLTLVSVAVDVGTAIKGKSDTQAQLEEQQQIATQMEAVIQEQTDLEAKIKSIDVRIDAIKKLRGSQAGPSAVLEALRERIISTPDIYLENLEQKGDTLTIKGSSSNERAVTQFGSSLEFSGGLFQNLNIETQRQEAPVAVVATNGTAPAAVETPKDETINFTIRCSYVPTKENTQKAPAGVTQAANGQPATAPQQPSNPQPTAAQAQPAQPQSSGAAIQVAKNKAE